jgi:predicted TIM-barrel fold metal-dependent hydrolase
MVVAAPISRCQALAQIKLDADSLRRALFGSDWPLFTPMLSLKEWVEAKEHWKRHSLCKWWACQTLRRKAGV